MRSIGHRTSENIVSKAYHRGQIVLFGLYGATQQSQQSQQSQPFDAKIGILKQILKNIHSFLGKRPIKKWHHKMKTGVISTSQ